METNKVMNLTAITDPADMAALHFLDSAALLTLADFRDKTVVDVGTGAGFPGLPLKILEPSIRLTLLDSLGKRVQFLAGACARSWAWRTWHASTAGRRNSPAEHRESFDIGGLPGGGGSAGAVRSCACPWCRPGGNFLAMKSVDSDEELAAARHAIEILGGAGGRTVRDYAIPGTEVRHRLILVKKIAKNTGKISQNICKNQKESLIIGLCEPL